jgi:hypothetical protein
LERRVSSPPVNLTSRNAIERVLEKTLEDTQRDLASFLKGRGDLSDLGPRREGEPGHDRQQEREDGGFRQPGRRAEPQPGEATRLVASPPAGPQPAEATRLATPPAGPQPADVAPLVASLQPRPTPAAMRSGRAAASLAAPQSFMTPGLVPAAPAEGALVEGAASAVASSAAAGPVGLVPPMVPPPERDLAERVVTERRATPDWPPIPPAPAIVPPMATMPGMPLAAGPTLSAIVPRKIQDRIDEYYRTGFLDEEPFHLEPVDPVPGIGRGAPMPRAGLPMPGYGEPPRPMPGPPQLALVQAEAP